MMSEYVLPLAHSQAVLETVGGKGAALARLRAAGLPVPDGFHITTAAYQQFVRENHLQPAIVAALQSVDILQAASLESAAETIKQLFLHAQIPSDIVQAINAAYTELSETGAIVAVRSSATAEDLPELSFAGQQETYLNIQGNTALLNAVKLCWASLWTARAIGYRTRNQIDHTAVSLAVIIQELVPAEVSGILFTANPMNGSRDEMVINAAWGFGEAIVGGLVTPDTLTVNKATGQVVSRQIADKKMMTVAVDGGTEEYPVAAELRQAPVLDDAVAVELVRLGKEIEALFNTPSDIEWVWAANRLHIVQARPITGLPAPQISSQTEWQLPNPKGKYVRTSIVDIMPDPLSPLFATLGLSTINHVLGDWAYDMTKTRNILPDDLLVTINGFAYYSMSFTKWQIWLMLIKLLPKYPRMLRTGVTVWREVAHPHYTKTVASWQVRPLRDLTISELLTGIHEVFDAASQHLMALMTTTMGPTAGSEALFTQVYQRLIKRPDDPPAPTFLMGFDSIPIRSEKALYDLAQWCREHPALAAFFTNTSPAQILMLYREGQTPPELDAELWHEWCNRFADYLEHYGYCIYTMDFATSLPMDNPLPMLEALKLFIIEHAKNPYERQQQVVRRREQAVQSVLERVGGLRRWLFRKTLNWAQSLAPLREDGLSEIGLGYPLLRQMFHELGRRFTEANVIAKAADIYWLTHTEIEQAVSAFSRNEPVNALTEQVRTRSAEWRSRKQLTPPPTLPPSKRLMGINLESFVPGTGEGMESEIVKGIGTSPGRVTAAAQVLLSSEDFSNMQPGAILVAPITTPAWTPLFTMAAGVITDVGGPLSHGSIVAREYGIPAVMGTGIATKRIHSGQTITIDGGAGLVFLSKLEAAEPPSETPQIEDDEAVVVSEL
jgi:rifampicin phosphotransferase